MRLDRASPPVALVPVALVPVAFVLAALLLGGSCTSESNLQADETSATPAPTFSGDADSRFCRRSADHLADPAPDPFAPDLRPDQVRARLDLVVERVDELAGVAPDPLREDLGDLQAGLVQLRAALDDVDYDFAELAGSDADLSVVNDPRFAGVSERIDAYQRQVCRLDV